MISEILSNSAYQWVFILAGLSILIAVAIYFLGRIKSGLNYKISTQEDNLVEFDRMMQKGILDPAEFKEIKKNLGVEIAEKTKRESNAPSEGNPETIRERREREAFGKKYKGFR